MTWLEATRKESEKRYEELVMLVGKFEVFRPVLSKEAFAQISTLTSLLGTEFSSLSYGNLKELRNTPLYTRLDASLKAYVDSANGVSFEKISSFQELKTYSALFEKYNERVAELYSLLENNLAQLRSVHT
ncbi:hypothetical protein COT72_03790 [archaeon CG10_big_fil_rev_8_21_14_0_10_43_11]|nr:MAG: hypothetical protein COT72_03790 [archaeon CG10_big_fil_rev_8_21_14_0_10_43_11]